MTEALQQWLDGGWLTGDDCTIASTFVKPGQPNKGWGASLGTWEQRNSPQLYGFNSSWDAWAFLFASTGIDAHARLPESVRRYESAAQLDLLDDPEPQQPVQWAMFNKEIE